MRRIISFIIGVALSFALVICAVRFATNFDMSTVVAKLHQLNEIQKSANTPVQRKVEEAMPVAESTNLETESQDAKRTVLGATEINHREAGEAANDTNKSVETIVPNNADAAQESKEYPTAATAPTVVDLSKAETLDEVYDGIEADVEQRISSEEVAIQETTLASALKQENAKEHIEAIWEKTYNALGYLE